MIANTSSGRRFGPLATYLVAGRSGLETDRVAWTAERNLGTDDPELAAQLMQATARQSVQVQVPVYHLTISFHPEDEVTPAQMEAVVDQVLRDLKLSEHQAMMVAHKDRDHDHVHVMVNRVHPETGVAWERWQDRPTIERSLREAEQAMGLSYTARSVGGPGAYPFWQGGPGGMPPFTFVASLSLTFLGRSWISSLFSFLRVMSAISAS